MRYFYVMTMVLGWLAAACNTAGGGAQLQDGDQAAAPSPLSDVPDDGPAVAPNADFADTELPDAPVDVADVAPLPALGLNLTETTVGAKVVLKIVSVRPDTAAANADLQIGDLLVALNGHAVNSLQDYDREMVRIGESGVRTILVRVFDRDQEIDIPVVLNP